MLLQFIREVCLLKIGNTFQHLFLFSQIALGVLSLKTNLNEPIFIIGHQLNASLFIAILTTLIFRNPFTKKVLNQPLNSQMVGINS